MYKYMLRIYPQCIIHCNLVHTYTQLDEIIIDRTRERIDQSIVYCPTRIIILKATILIECMVTNVKYTDIYVYRVIFHSVSIHVICLLNVWVSQFHELLN